MKYHFNIFSRILFLMHRTCTNILTLGLNKSSQQQRALPAEMTEAVLNDLVNNWLKEGWLSDSISMIFKWLIASHTCMVDVARVALDS